MADGIFELLSNVSWKTGIKSEKIQHDLFPDCKIEEAPKT
jgi:hypothetical protein